MSNVILIAGVSGSGKTTVGRALAETLGVPFYDGDDFHPPENVEKMANGIPLNDEDRIPWLGRLHDLISEYLAKGETAVIACSALKQKYREQLRNGNDGLVIVYLDGSFEMIEKRMQARQDHFMKSGMLKSQFAALERPSSHNTIVVDAENDVDVIVQDILKRITA